MSLITFLLYSLFFRHGMGCHLGVLSPSLFRGLFWFLLLWACSAKVCHHLLINQLSRHFGKLFERIRPPTVTYLSLRDVSLSARVNDAFHAFETYFDKTFSSYCYIELHNLSLKGPVVLLSTAVTLMTLNQNSLWKEFAVYDISLMTRLPDDWDNHCQFW